MSIWAAIGIVCLAGAIGGVVSSFISNNSDSSKTPTTQVGIFLPGFISHVLLGAVAAGLSWALYGPASEATIAVIGSPPAQAATTYSLTLSALAGAVLVGIGGANWIASQVNKKATVAAAQKTITEKKPTSDDLKIFKSKLLASPVDALAFAKGLPNPTPT